jgi:hypothetical protein
MVQIVLVALLLACPVFAQPMVVDPNGGSRPNPDPTVLGTAAMDKALAAQAALFDSKIAAILDEINRIKISDDAVDQRLIKRVDEVPTVIDTAIAHLKILVEEKFKGVDQQFLGRDTALAAALLAQKTSVADQQAANAASAAKQEANFIKQIDAIGLVIANNQKGTEDKIESAKQLFATQTKSTDDKIGDIRSIVTGMQSRGVGQNDVWVYLIGGGGLVLAVCSALIALFHARSQPPQYSPYGPSNGYPPPPYPQVSVLPAVVPVATPSAPR